MNHYEQTPLRNYSKLKRTLIITCSSIGLVHLTNCSAIDASLELENLNKSMNSINASIIEAIQPALKNEIQDIPKLAAENNEVWFLSESCIAYGTQEIGAAITKDDKAVIAKLSDCKITKEVSAESEITISGARVVQRKIGVLTEYVSSISALASADSDQEILQALAAFVVAVEDLNNEVSSGGLSDFVRELKENQEKISGTAKFVIENLRAQQLFETVNNSKATFSRITHEIRTNLRSMDIEPEFFIALEGLEQAESRSLESVNLADLTEREAAMRNLQVKHEAFLEIANGSIYTKLNLLELVHTALADRLSRSPDIEEILKFIESLKALADTLEIN